MGSIQGSLGLKMSDHLSKRSPLRGRYPKMSGPGIKIRLEYLPSFFGNQSLYYRSQQFPYFLENMNEFGFGPPDSEVLSYSVP